MDWTSIVMAIVPVGIGVIFLWKKTSKILNAMKELGDVLTIIPQALSDQKLTKDEMAEVRQEINEALMAFRDILK